MKRVFRALLEALLDRAAAGKARRHWRHHDEVRYGWQGRNRDRHYRDVRYGKPWKSKKPKGLLARLRSAF
jgi:hypothetical protein